MSKEVKTKKPMMITIGGRQYPCRITMGAMVRFKQRCGHDISELDVANIEELMLFVWCCIASACVADRVEFDVAPEEFPDYVEPADLEEFMASLAEAEKKTTPKVTKKPTSTV